MDNNNFYIILLNRFYRHEDNNDYHLERIFSNEQVQQIISNDFQNFKLKRIKNIQGNGVIITNDDDLLTKYVFAINLDEFKLLCGIEDFDKNNIRINNEYFDNYDDQIFRYFNKIFTGELISANQEYENVKYYPYDDETISIHSKEYRGWQENMEFIYFQTPSHYRIGKFSEVFQFKNYKVGNIVLFKNLININILEIGQINSLIRERWDSKNNGVYKYFDKISYRRLFIPEKILSDLQNDNALNFIVKTIFTKYHYIEYHIIDIYNSDYFKDDYEEKQEFFESYDKYNQYNGFTDNIIDSAFDGDPDLTWNID